MPTEVSPKLMSETAATHKQSIPQGKRNASRKSLCPRLVVRKSVVRDVVVKDKNEKDVGTLSLKKDGIVAFIGKSKNGTGEKFVITGFDDWSEKDKATNAIKLVIDSYSYTPEFVIVKEQVGVVASQANIPLSKENESEIKEQYEDALRKYEEASEDFNKAVGAIEYTASLRLRAIDPIWINAADLDYKRFVDDNEKALEAERRQLEEDQKDAQQLPRAEKRKKRDEFMQRAKDWNKHQEDFVTKDKERKQKIIRAHLNSREYKAARWYLERQGMTFRVDGFLGVDRSTALQTVRLDLGRALRLKREARSAAEDAGIKVDKHVDNVTDNYTFAEKMNRCAKMVVQDFEQNAAQEQGSNSHTIRKSLSPRFMLRKSVARRACETLNNVFSKIRNDKDFKGEYGLKNVYKMVAELSNIDFRQKLKRKNLWVRIVDSIAKIVRVFKKGYKAASALETAEGALYKLLDNYKPYGGKDEGEGEPLALKLKDEPPIQKHLGRVDDWLVAEAAKSGVNIDGYSHEITDDFIRHVKKEHTDIRREEARGNVAVTDEDFAHLKDVIENPDFILLGVKRDKRDRIIYCKQLKDGSALYFEEVLSKKNKKLNGKTFFKKKGEITEDKLIRILSVTSRNDLKNARAIKRMVAKSTFGISRANGTKLSAAVSNDQLTTPLTSIPHPTKNASKKSLHPRLMVKKSIARAILRQEYLCTH